MASLCTRSMLRRSSRGQPSVGLCLKRQLATEVQSQTSALHATPPAAPPPVQTTPSVEDASAVPAKGGRRNRKSRYPDGKLRTLETMPFIAFQEALKILKLDTLEKQKLIREKEEKIKAWKKHKGATDDDAEIKSMKAFIEEQKLNIDKNNPRIKYMYDNKKGEVDIHRPIYQYWDDQKWRSMRRRVLMQRLEQMNVVADVIPSINPIVDVELKFRRRRVPLGGMMNSGDVGHYPSVKVIPFDSKERLVTVVVVDPDVPNLDKNGFDFHLQWMVANCPVSIEKQVAIGRSTRSEGRDEIAPYEIPYVHKGENYHRYCVFIFEQPGRLDIPGSEPRNAGTAGVSTSQDPLSTPVGEATEGAEKISTVFSTKPQGEERIKRHGFNLRSFMAKHKLTAIGAHLWRVEFDNNMMKLMKDLGVPTWNQKFVKHHEFI